VRLKNSQDDQISGLAEMRMAVLVAVFALGLFGTARAQAPYDDPKTPMGWAWAKIRSDEPADFNEKCGKALAGCGKRARW
jgi:hypothetical protein